jgi:general secretion pathway protein C
MRSFPFNKFKIINYTIIALIIIYGLILTRNIINAYHTGDVSQTRFSEDSGTLNTLKPSNDIMSYAPIVEKNPFGPPLKFHPIVKSTSSRQKQGSPSELVLYGTVTGPDNLSYAIITDNSQPSPVRQDLFAYGDDVYGHGTLTKISSDSVEITKDGDIYTLYLFDVRNIRAESDKSPSAGSGSLVRRVSDKQYLLDQRKVQQALNDPEKVLSDARLYPNIKNGIHEGFKILEVKRGGIYDNLGLRNRDVLLRINGLDLTSPDAAMQAMTALRGMKSVNLDIIRSGSKMTLSYQIQ